MIGAISGIEALASKVSSVGGVATTATQRLAAAAPSAAQPLDFGQVLSQVAGSAMDNVKAAEQAAISGLSGKASVQQVVEAVMSAERSLQTAIAIRDKLTAAYQEVSRMAI